MKKKTINIGFPMEYEDDDHVCHYGTFLRENEVKAVEEKLQELQRKDNIINNTEKYIKSFDAKIITQRELCILNDIMLIITNHEDMVDRLKELENGNK